MSPPSFIATGDADRVLTHEAHLRRCWITEPTMHVRNVPQPIVRSPARIGKSRIACTEANAPSMRSCTRSLPSRRTPRGDRVLLLQRILDRRQRNAERGQPGIADLDPDLLVLEPDQFDLACVGHALQLELEALGVVLEHRVVEAFPVQRVDVAEGIAEFIIEERADHPFWQGRMDVADLLAHLIPQLRDVAGWHRVACHEDHLRLAGARVRAE